VVAGRCGLGKKHTVSTLRNNFSIAKNGKRGLFSLVDECEYTFGVLFVALKKDAGSDVALEITKGEILAGGGGWYCKIPNFYTPSCRRIVVGVERS
jgi:hypothetical protein